MACLAPLQIKNKFGQYFFVPCGKCIACAETKRKQWVYRMECESMYNDDTLFVTLTYRNECLTWGSDFPTLVKKDVSDFNKKLKRKLKHFCDIRYYVSGEYGDEELRPHYHGIYFIKYKTYERDLKTRLDYVVSTFNQVWDKGFTEVDTTTYGALYYVAKYTAKGLAEVPPGVERPFSICSKHPYIGCAYVGRNSRYIRQNTNPRYKRFDIDRPRDVTDCIDTYGNHFPMPRIFLRKIFGEQKLNWLEWSKFLQLQEHQLAKRIDESWEVYKKRFPSHTSEDYVNYINQQKEQYEKFIKRNKDRLKI